MNPILATVLTFAAAIAWLRLMDFCAHRSWIEPRLSRKIIHIGTGPIYVLCWLMFPVVWYSRYLAMLVPLLITAQFVLVGTGLLKDEAAVQAMSRTGDRREILRGPLYYGIMFVLLTIFFWTENPIGIVALMMMCGGDGLADVTGRYFNSPKLPYSPEKSIAGSLGVFFGGWILSALVVWIYVLAGFFLPPVSSYLLPITIVAVVGTLVESLPFKDIDNITVTLASVLVGWFVF